MSDIDFPQFSEEDLLLRDSARRFSVEKLAPFLASLPDEPISKPDMLRLYQLVRPFGMLGGRVPARYGGDELTFTQMGLLYEAFPAEASMIASTSDLNAFRISQGDNQELRERYLPGILSGEIVVASAISEPNAGSDVSGIRTRAELQGDHYIVNGQKVWSSAGDAADVLIAAVACGKDERGRSLVGRLLVDKRQSTVVTRVLPMLGMRRHGMCEIFFDNCVVPKGNMIGTPGDGDKALSASWLSHRVYIGLIAVHIAQEALDRALDYAKLRVQFGRPIGANQLIQSMLVDMSVAVETSRYLCYRALHLLDRGIDSRYASSVAKLHATEAAVKVTAHAMQIHGASGLSAEVGIEKLHRDARMLTIPDGTSEIQRLIAGRELLGINAIRG
jgi:alkylation response protein AidB-like acyl-CoA dehydrogenase